MKMGLFARRKKSDRVYFSLYTIVGLTCPNTQALQQVYECQEEWLDWCAAELERFFKDKNIAARKCGVYGTDLRGLGERSLVKICQRCDEVFIAQRSSASFCSVECKEKARYADPRAKKKRRNYMKLKQREYRERLEKKKENEIRISRKSR